MMKDLDGMKLGMSLQGAVMYFRCLVYSFVHSDKKNVYSFVHQIFPADFSFSCCIWRVINKRFIDPGRLLIQITQSSLKH